MGQAENTSSFSMTHVSFTAVVILIAATFFGLKSGGGDGEKSGEKQAGENSAHAAMPFALAGNDEPHRAFVLNYLRGAAVKSVADSCFTEAEAKNVEFLIATVPDPIDTVFGCWYDQAIESLTRAVCDTGRYAPAGQWNPWEQYRLMVARQDAKAAEACPPEALFERFPGVLLFRGKEHPGDALAVLLVSETANSVRAEALKQALSLAGEIQEARCGQDSFRLIAPIFTGSQPSLLRALREWAESNPYHKEAHFDVISGSAGALAKFKSDSDRAQEVWERRAVSLHATVIPSETLGNAALSFLKKAATIPECANAAADLRYRGNGVGRVDPCPDPEGVAFLVESNTGFGRAVQKERKADHQWPMYLPYPMHISRLQATYAKKRRELEKRLGLSGIWTDRTSDDFAVRPNADTIASLAEAVTAPINDRAVDDLTATIRQNPVRFVGLLATDPQDKVFLAQRIKRDCPNVDLFITSMDSIYTLAENRESMRGVLVATTYPLCPSSQWWVEPTEPRRQTFKSQGGQGYYNAAGFHLAEIVKDKPLQDLLQEYAPPVFPARPGESVKPPVWIVVIGEKGRVVPLTFFDEYETDINNADGSPLVNGVSSHPEKVESARIGVPPLGQYRTLALLVLVTVVPTLVLSLLRPRWVFFGPKLLPAQSTCAKEWWEKLLAPMDPEQQRVSVYHNLVLSSFSISIVSFLSIACILLTGSFTTERLQYGSLQHACVWAMVAFLGTAWLVTVLLQIRLVVSYFRTKKSLPKSPWPLNWYWRLLTHAFLFVGSFIFGVCLLIPLAFTAPVQVAAHVLFADRSVAVSTGYSVLAPTLFMSAAFLIYAYFALKRDYLGERFRVKCPYPSLPRERAKPSPVSRVCDQICQLNDEVHQDLTDSAGYRWRHRHLLLVSAVVLVPAALIVAARARGTWEGRLWDVLFLTEFLILATLAVLALLRFVQGWKGLERILKLIATVPMVRAFDRLPRKTAGLFGGYLFARRPRVSHLAIPSHILCQLRDEVCERADAENEEVVTVTRDPHHGGSPNLEPGEPVPAGARTEHARTRQTKAKGQGSPAPQGVEIPVAIVQRLRGRAFEDYMSQRDADQQAPPDRGADQEASPDREYPAPEINKFSEEAQQLIRILEPYWRQHTIADAFGEQPTKGESEKKPVEEPQRMPSWVEKAEDFIAIQVIIFLSQHFILLRTMALSLVWVSMFLFLAATVYPFRPEQLILYLLLGLLAIVVGAVLWVLVRINKNEIISRITQSTPNKFEWSWAFMQALVQVIAPIGIIVAAHLSGRLRVIAEPLLDMIK